MGYFSNLFSSQDDEREAIANELDWIIRDSGMITKNKADAIENHKGAIKRIAHHRRAGNIETEVLRRVVLSSIKEETEYRDEREEKAKRFLGIF